ncbi:hypothetical protein [Nocardia australiensis]|uniref:hypothetical protein n=1 Tax=Nocardia australiensis TaxID=2887191 RepID=UPI003558427F
MRSMNLDVLAFKDIRPMTPGHLQVIPRTWRDGFGLRGRPTSSRRGDLDYLAGSIRGALERSERGR